MLPLQEVDLIANRYEGEDGRAAPERDLRAEAEAMVSDFRGKVLGIKQTTAKPDVAEKERLSPEVTNQLLDKEAIKVAHELISLLVQLQPSLMTETPEGTSTRHISRNEHDTLAFELDRAHQLVSLAYNFDRGRGGTAASMSVSRWNKAEGGKCDPTSHRSITVDMKDGKQVSKMNLVHGGGETDPKRTFAYVSLQRGVGLEEQQLARFQNEYPGIKGEIDTALQMLKDVFLPKANGAAAHA